MHVWDTAVGVLLRQQLGAVFTFRGFSDAAAAQDRFVF
jgi:hypothetical protein